MYAQRERRYDDYQRMADEAWMMRAAYHAEKLKPSDLYKRPVDEEVAKNKSNELKEKAIQASEWLSQFEQFTTVRKEDVNG